MLKRTGLVFGVLLFALLVLAGSVSAQDFLTGKLDRKMEAPAADAYGALGTSIYTLPDINGDGGPEILIGAPDVSKAYLCSQKDFSVLATFTGEAGSQFGASVFSFISYAGGNKKTVLLAGAPAHKNGKIPVGAVYGYNADGEQLFKFEGRALSNFGQCIRSGGIDKNNYNSFLVSSPGGRNKPGMVGVYTYTGAGVLHKKDISGIRFAPGFGSSLASAGGGVLIGANYFDGAVYAFNSNENYTLTKTFYGNNQQQLGWSLFTYYIKDLSDPTIIVAGGINSIRIINGKQSLDISGDSVNATSLGRSLGASFVRLDTNGDNEIDYQKNILAVGDPSRSRVLFFDLDSDGKDFCGEIKLPDGGSFGHAIELSYDEIIITDPGQKSGSGAVFVYKLEVVKN